MFHAGYTLTAAALLGMTAFLTSTGIHLKNKILPSIRTQFLWILIWMILALRYVYLPNDGSASGLLVAVYDPLFNLFPGNMHDDFVPCPDGIECSPYLPIYQKHVSWTVKLFQMTLGDNSWTLKFLQSHTLFCAFALCAMPLQLYYYMKGRLRVHRVLGRVATLAAIVGCGSGMYISYHNHGHVAEYNGVYCLIGFWLMGVTTIGCGVAGYLAAKRGDMEAHRRWMLRFFGSMFGAYFFWRFEAYLFGWMLSGPNGVLLNTYGSFMLGIILFEFGIIRRGFYPVRSAQKKVL